MKKAKWLLIGILLSFLIGCNDKGLFKEEKETVQSKASEMTEPLSIDTTKFEVVPTDSPNKYKVTIHWSKLSGSVKILANGKSIFQTSGKMNIFDDFVDGGASIDYELQQFDGSGAASMQIQKKITIPLDYVFSEKVVLSENVKFKGGRLFLLNKPLVQTLGFNMSFDVDEVISDDATIETYPLNSKRMWQETGDSGGNISITARNGKGHLIVVMRGVHGGDGRGSVCLVNFNAFCNAGGGGKGGDAGYFSLNLENNENFALTKYLEPGMGGAPGIACECNLSAGQNPLPHMISGFDGNCMGYGIGRSNGPRGLNGTGQLCYKLRKEDAYVCN